MAGKGLRILLIAWGTVEILLFGGLIFGWASLVYVFKREGYFAELCALDGTQENVSVRPELSLVTVENSEWEGMMTEYIYGGGRGSYTPTMIYNTTRGSSNVLSSSNRSLDSASEGVVTCDAQDKQFNLIYTLATVINGVALFVNGWLMDKYGTRACRCLGIVTYVAATLMAAFSLPSTAFLLYPSMILLSLGGYYFIMTNFQLGNILPNKRSTIISLYCGAYDSSAFVLLLFKFAYEGGVPLQTSFLLLTVAFSICIISTFWFMPRMRIPHPIPDNYTISLSCSCEKHKTPPRLKNDVELNGSSADLGKAPPGSPDKLIENSAEEKPKEQLLDSSASSATSPPTFYSLVASPLFLSDLVWLTCHRFASWSFVGRLNPALTNLANGDNAIVSQYTSTYAALQFFGIFLAPLSGRLMDRRRKLDPNTPKNAKLDKLEVCVASFLLDSTVGLLLAVTLSIPVMEVQYLSFVLHVIHRACLYGPNSAFIAQAFPMEHFGKLFGLAMSFSAAFSLLQFPIFMMIQGPLNGNPLAANLFTLVLMVISYGHPLYITLWCRKQRKLDLRSDVSISKVKSPKSPEEGTLLPPAEA